MRTNVSFRHPAKFVQIPEVDDVLAVSGAEWFAELLRRIPGLNVQPELCQEDWGVVLFCQKDENKFWVGLSSWPDGENEWLAHVHHASFAWLQWFRKTGKAALETLVVDLHQILASEPSISQITWYYERGMTAANPEGAAKPDVP